MMHQKKLLVFLGILSLTILVQLRNCSRTVNPQEALANEHRGAGGLLAKNIDALLSPGVTLLVILPDWGGMESPVLTAMIDDFSKSLKQSGRACEVLKVPLDESRMMHGPFGGFQEGELSDILGKRSSPPAAVASLVGLPFRSDPPLENIPVYAIANSEESAESALRRGQAQGVVVDVRSPSIPPQQRNYQFLKP